MRARWVRYGAEAGEALRAEISAIKGAEPLTPVTVVVPSNHVGVSIRRRLATGAFGPVTTRGIGLAGVTFLTTYRLAEMWGAPSLASQARRPVSTPVIAAAIRRVLVARPGMFGPIAEHPATEAALVTTYQELREVSPVALGALAATGSRAAGVVRVFREVRRTLEASWYDEQDLMIAAAARVGDANVALGAVIVYLPQRVSPHAAGLLRAVGKVTDVAVVAGLTGEPAADAEVRTSLARLGVSGDLRSDAAPVLEGVVDVERTRIVTTSDADDEVRAAVRAVVDAARGGTPLARIAVLYASPAPYARLVHEQLAAAGIATNGAAVVPVAARMVGRCLLELLALPAKRFARHDVLAWMSSAPVCVHGRRVPNMAWERVSRAAGVVAGRADWDARLSRMADEHEEAAKETEENPDLPAWRADRDRREAADARRLRSFVLGLIDDLEGVAAAPMRWSERSAWAGDLLARVLGGSALRLVWPVEERRAHERVELALARLAALDAVEGPVSLDVYIRTLELELQGDLGRTGRFGEGVLVAPISMGIGIDLDLVVVLGLAEGTFPSRVLDDSLLPDHERASTVGELDLRSARTARQHHQLLATLAGAARQVITMPRGDLRRSSERVPSRWLLDIAGALAGARWWAAELHEARVPWVEHVPSFAAGIHRSTSPATAQEHRLRSMAASPTDLDMLQASADRLLAAGARLVAARRSDSFTRFDGNLAGLVVPSPVDAPTSSTRLESWAACPHAYLMANVLKVEEVSNPEEELEITALDRGSLVHEVLDLFMCEVLARPVEDRPGPDDPWTPDDRKRLRTIGEEVCADYTDRGLTGRPIFWRRERAHILADLERTLDMDERERRLRRTRPLATELPFGFSWCATEAVPITLPDGRIVRFRGKADRVDISDDGTIYVVDYKTGRVNDANKLTEDDPDLGGRKLQLAVYGVAARLHQAAPDADVISEYWFVSTKGKFAHHGYRVTDDVLRRVGETITTMVGGIDAGVFPSHPTELSSRLWPECPSCDPDNLGVTELRRAWERKRTDPALTVYAQMLEPLEPLEADADAGEGGADGDR